MGVKDGGLVGVFGALQSFLLMPIFYFFFACLPVKAWYRPLNGKILSNSAKNR